MLEKTLNQWLDETKEKLGIDTDYKLAKVLGISQGRMGDFRHGRRAPSAAEAFRLAELLHADPGELIASIEYEREQNPEKRSVFQRFLDSTKHAACIAALSVGLLLGSAIGLTDQSGGKQTAALDAVVIFLALTVRKRLRII